MTCAICEHIERKEIEACLFDDSPSNSLKEISKRFSVKPGQLLKHKQQHMAQNCKELVNLVTDEYNKKMKETGVAKALTSIEVLDLIIAKAPELIDTVTMNDILRALKLKAELLGTVTQKQEVKLSWLEEVPDAEKEVKQE